MKNRLIDAAIAIDRSGHHITMGVLQGGIRMMMMRQDKDGRVMKTENFTPWTAIEDARINPLVLVMRDLINQMDEQVPVNGG